MLCTNIVLIPQVVNLFNPAALIYFFDGVNLKQAMVFMSILAMVSSINWSLKSQHPLYLLLYHLGLGYYPPGVQRSGGVFSEEFYRAPPGDAGSDSSDLPSAAGFHCLRGAPGDDDDTGGRGHTLRTGAGGKLRTFY